jgi:membrane protein DedA with SNARE-associated domain
LVRQFPHLLNQWGYLAIILAIIADSLGVPIPGEVMLLLAAVYAGATHHLSLPLIAGSAALGAVVGDNFTYTLGRRGGYPLLRRYGRFVHLEQRRLKIGEYLFRRYGGVVVWAGRLIPVLHIWTAVLAGTNRMPWPRFALANAIGAIVWATGLSLIGYSFGSAALHVGGIIAGAAVPLAIVIAGIVVLLLRANERRLYAEAEQMLGADDDPPE